MDLYVCLRPKTQEAKDMLEQFGDIWTVGMDVPAGPSSDDRKLYLECRSDIRSKGMWVNEKYDELFEVIYY